MTRAGNSYDFTYAISIAKSILLIFTERKFSVTSSEFLFMILEFKSADLDASFNR